MTMIRYQPRHQFHREFWNEVNRAFDRNSANAQESSAEWSPAVDIREHADRFVLLVDVPGIDPATIDLTLEKGVLVVSGAREKTPAAEGVEVRRSERASGRFERRFNLPDTVDADAVSAHGSQGVLEIAIPKRPAVQPRKIAVSH